MKDRRTAIRRSALSSPLLKWRERAILAALTELPVETDDDGNRVHGCYAMRPDGTFRHRREYLSEQLRVSEDSLKDAFRGLREVGAISAISGGKNALAVAYQALDLRGGESTPLIQSENTPQATQVRSIPSGGENTPHTCKTPNHRNHTPTPREEPQSAVTEKDAPRSEHPPTPVAFPPTAALEQPPTENPGDQDDDPDAIFLPRRSA